MKTMVFKASSCIGRSAFFSEGGFQVCSASALRRTNDAVKP